MKMLYFANGDAMPILGLGTWKSDQGNVYNAVKTALRSGYRHIDCAPIYGNEVEVGNAINDSISEGVLTRDQLWVTSKLWNNAHAVKHVQPALERTLADLHLDVLDLFLIHWPILIKPGLLYNKSGHDLLPLEQIPLSETWGAMERLVKKGMCKHIGVSNFSIAKMESLIESSRIPPEMNQVELHPYLRQKDLLDFCSAHNVHLTAYAPLGSSDRPDRLKTKHEPVLLHDRVVRKIAEKHGVSPAQVLIKWSIERNVAVIPKSVRPDRIKQNFEATALALTDQDIAELNALDKHRRYISGSFWAMEGSPYTINNIWDE